MEWNVVTAGRVMYFVAHDVTIQRAEREQLHTQERELLEARDFVNGVTDNMAEGMFALNSAGRLTFLNAAASKLLGWTEAELFGQPLHEIIHFERLDGTAHPVAECPMLKTHVTGEILRIDRDVFIRRDGTHLPVSYSSSPLQRHGAIGCVVVFSDITAQLSEELRTERQLERVSWVGGVQDAIAQD
jgi:PAS domain S-box-containing protein